MKNLFEILNVDKNATQEQIRQAYKMLKPNKDNDKIEDVYDQAYAILMDPKTREIHRNSIIKLENRENMLPKPETLRLNQKNSAESYYEIKLKEIDEEIKQIDQNIARINQSFNIPYRTEYKSKLNSLNKEKEDALAELKSQRAHAIETRLKTPGAKEKINDIYDGFEHELIMKSSKAETQLKQQYKKKLLVENIGNLPLQLEYEELVAKRKMLQEEKEKLIQYVYFDPSISEASARIHK